MKLPRFLESPFFTFCIPPGMAILQFLLGSYLFSLGFPDVPPHLKVKAGLLISLLFVLCLLPLIGVAVGFRQILYGQNKAVSGFGAAFNSLYFLGCSLFFFLVFVTHSSQ